MSKIYERVKSLNDRYAHKLAKCTFCGCSPVIMIERSVFVTEKESRYFYSVTCQTKSCDFATGKTLHEVIDKWNQRHEMEIKNYK